MGQEESALIKEGSAQIFFPSDVDKSEVFYNPVQNFNRDLTCLVLQTFNEEQKHKTKLFEAFSATGLRSIRYAKEVTGFDSIIANDIDPNAVKIIERNLKINGVSGTVKSSLGDANHVMNKYQKSFDIIDLDPYSTVSIFLDSAINAVKNGGLLCITSTDGRTLCGQMQEQSYAWYNVMIVKCDFCHEFGIRALLTTIRTIAAKYKRTVEPLLSLAANFYFRVFVRVWDDSPNDIAETNSLFFYSPDTHYYYLQPIGKKVVRNGNASVRQAPVTVPGFTDPYTGTPMQIGGPLYTGPIQNKDFIKKLLDNIPKMKYFATIPRIEATLNSCIREIDAPFYHDLSIYTSILRCRTPSRELVVSVLEKMGYKTSGTHAKPGMIKTDASPEIIWNILRTWYGTTGKTIPEEESVARSVLIAPGSIDVPLDVDPDVKERLKLEKEICKYYSNPEKNFGPKPAAKSKKTKKSK